MDYTSGVHHSFFLLAMKYSSKEQYIGSVFTILRKFGSTLNLLNYQFFFFPGWFAVANIAVMLPLFLC